MRPTATLKHEFVRLIPEALEEGTLYISVEFATASHKCFCGCGHKVVTPLAPAGWELTFNGESVSLYPSIGNWSLTCRSHYWIEDGRVRWAPQWSDEEVRAGRARDGRDRERYYESRRRTTIEEPDSRGSEPTGEKPQGCLWQWLRRLFS
jgi:hypothetical protein